jgi:hypothetical protein
MMMTPVSGTGVTSEAAPIRSVSTPSANIAQVLGDSEFVDVCFADAVYDSIFPVICDHHEC